jgi:DNA repair protein RecN (Recombination protein N)
MLTQLSIRNILLLKGCDIPFGAGLNALTGETGAGKSILLDALGLVLGERSDAGLVRQGETQASVTAEFSGVSREVRALLEELALPVSDALVIRRTLAADGKSRAFVNDEPVSVTALKRLGEWLIERNGQHDQRGLLDTKTHRALLDRYAGNEALLLQQTSSAFARWKEALARCEELARLREAALREEQWLRQTVDELGALAPEEGEEEQLLELRRQAQTVKQSLSHLQHAYDALMGGDGVALRVRQSAKALAKAEGETAEAIHASLERAETEIEEASVALERLLNASEIDPAAVERAEDRLHALRAAGRKFNLPVAMLASHLAEARVKLSAVESGEQQAKEAASVLHAAKTRYQELSAA